MQSSWKSSAKQPHYENEHIEIVIHVFLTKKLEEEHTMCVQRKTSSFSLHLPTKISAVLLSASQMSCNNLSNPVISHSGILSMPTIACNNATRHVCTPLQLAHQSGIHLGLHLECLLMTSTATLDLQRQLHLIKE